ncbi:hypothetical protein L916_08709 [Phytophthora nicotianae]|uniref:Uncharacterized protein n=1 Tax=Phytophthora nicotianae TaxID=4792 RepID=W2J0S9_PHYNI|nr:hypothetical protein L916_08709 [Phytophthora nicotianae]
MICKAFVAAVYNGNTDVVGHLRDDHRFSSESMGESFASAARSNHFELMNRSMMNIAFLPRQFFQLYENGEWPLDILKEALEASYYYSIKNFIYRLTCEQLFYSKDEERLESIEWMETQKDKSSM